MTKPIVDTKVTREDIENILEAMKEAMAEKGLKLETATLYPGNDEEPEILIDNREPESIN